MDSPDGATAAAGGDRHRWPGFGTGRRLARDSGT